MNDVEIRQFIEKFQEKVEAIYTLAQQRTLTGEEAQLWGELIDAVSELKMELPEARLTVQLSEVPQ